MIDLLFVYGTLRRDLPESRHPLIDAECTYIGRARVRGVLYDLGPYPAVVPSKGETDIVVGELYRMREPEIVLKRLDAYEGTDYDRRVFPVEMEDRRETEAWIYVFDAPPEDGQRIESGDYLEHRTVLDR